MTTTSLICAIDRADSTGIRDRAFEAYRAGLISINEALELINWAWITCLSVPGSRPYTSARMELKHWASLRKLRTGPALRRPRPITRRG